MRNEQSWLKKSTIRKLAAFAFILCSCVAASPDCQGLGGTGIVIDPSEQDIDDGGYAMLVAVAQNMPAEANDRSAVYYRWTVLTGEGSLSGVGTGGESGKTIKTAPGSSELGDVAIFMPDLGFSGVADVQVEAMQTVTLTKFDASGGAYHETQEEQIAFSVATINVNSKLRLRLSPPSTLLPSGGTVSLKAYFEDDHGFGSPEDNTPQVVERQYEWSLEGGLAGAGTLDAQADSDTAVFKAGNETTKYTVSVKVTEVYDDGSSIETGPAKAQVAINADLKTVVTFGYYLPSIEQINETSSQATAWVYWPKIQGAISYSIHITGVHDGTGAVPDPFSTSFTVDEAGVTTPQSTDDGGVYKFGLSGCGGPIDWTPGCLDWFNGRFSGIRIQVIAAVQD